MVKTYFDYAPKQAARQRLVNFVIRHYKKRERRNLRMACLPGAEALDIHRVSDVLGIPRYNVTGIERDDDVFDKLKDMGLGINLFHGTDREFFERTSDDFDIISMDYFGMLTPKKVEDLDVIFIRRILKDKAILNTNFYGSRENKSVRTVYETPFAVKAMASKSLEILEGRLDHLNQRVDIARNLTDLQKTVKECQNILDSGKLSVLRDGITEELMGLALSVPIVTKLLQLDVPEFNKFSTGFNRTQAIDFSLNLANSQVFRNLPIEFQEYFLRKESLPYYCDDVERYRYVSDDKSPMLTDILLLNTHREFYDEGMYPISFPRTKQGFKCLIKGKDCSEFDSTNTLYSKCQRQTFYVASYLTRSFERIRERVNLN